MTPEAARTLIQNALRGIAPEADLDEVDPADELTTQLDLDSMDFLNFVIAMHREFKVGIPEADYAKVASLDGCAAYIQAHQAAVAG